MGKPLNSSVINTGEKIVLKSGILISMGKDITIYVTELPKEGGVNIQFIVNKVFSPSITVDEAAIHNGFTIGRGQDVDQQFDDKFLSGRHGKISFESGRIIFTSVSETNKSFVSNLTNTNIHVFKADESINASQPLSADEVNAIRKHCIATKEMMVINLKKLDDNIQAKVMALPEAEIFNGMLALPINEWERIDAKSYENSQSAPKENVNDSQISTQLPPKGHDLQ